MAAMRLVQECTLSLDEDVNKTLKSWRVPENDLMVAVFIKFATHLWV
jgi:hypothetical protein